MVKGSMRVKVAVRLSGRREVGSRLLVGGSKRVVASGGGGEERVEGPWEAIPVSTGWAAHSLGGVSESGSGRR